MKKIDYEAIKEFITEKHLSYDKDYEYSDDKVFLSFLVFNNNTFVHREKVYLNQRDECDKLLQKFVEWSKVMNSEKDKYSKTLMDLRWYDTYINDATPYYIWMERKQPNMCEFMCTRFGDGLVEYYKWITE